LKEKIKAIFVTNILFMQHVTNIIFLLFFLLSSPFAISQTHYTGNIVLKTQSAIDSFPINYPDVTHVLGALFIGSGDSLQNGSIRDLTPLSQVQSVFDLYVSRNDSLKTLYGLHHIDSVDNLVLYRNHGLIDLRGLDNLFFCVTAIYVEECNGLQKLTGLESVEYASDISIKNNTNLETISGLQKIKYSYIFVADNKSLKSLGLLSAFKLGRITIENNPALTGIGSFPAPNKNDLTSIVSFTIKNNPSLKNLDDFDLPGGALSALVIQGNTNLENIDGLRQLKQSREELIIEDNPALKRFDLRNLETANRIEITNNGIDSISPFESLRFVESLKLSGCKALRYLHNILPIVDSIMWLYEISSNPELYSVHEDQGPKHIGVFALSNPKLRYITGFEALETVNVDQSGNGDIKISKSANPDSLFLLSGFNKLKEGSISIVMGGIAPDGWSPDTTGYLGTVSGFNGLKKSDFISFDCPDNASVHNLSGFNALKEVNGLSIPKIIDTLDAFASLNDEQGKIFRFGIDSNTYVSPSTFSQMIEMGVIYSGAYKGTNSSTVVDTLSARPVCMPNLKNARFLWIETPETDMTNRFPSLEQVAYLVIQQNKELKKWDDFPKLAKISDKIVIEGNDALHDCRAICNILNAALPVDVTINNTLAPCRDRAIVNAWCDTLSVRTITQPSIGLFMSIVPNPASMGANVNLNLPVHWSGKLQIKMVGLSSGLTRATSIDVYAGEANFILPSTFPSGVYVVTCGWEGEALSQKLILVE
jgi:hypothetical protein